MSDSQRQSQRQGQSQSQSQRQGTIQSHDNDHHDRRYSAQLSNGFLRVEMKAAGATTTVATTGGSPHDLLQAPPQPKTDDTATAASIHNGSNNENNDDTNSNSNSNSNSASSSLSPPEKDCTIPETVLQYERQLRKNRAAKRASAPLERSQLQSNVLHNDNHIVVVNKPSGVLTVPGIHSNPSLLTFLYDEYKDGIERDMKMEHMIIHRLDMDTSGIVIFAKDKQSMSKLQKSFRDRHVEKEYEALVCGHLPLDITSGCINLPLQRDHEYPPFMRVATPESERQAQAVVKDLNHAGWKKIIKKKPKPSETRFDVLGREFVFVSSVKSNAGVGVGVEAETTAEGKDNKQESDNGNDDADGDKNNKDSSRRAFPVTRLRLKPITGRTHQLRVHCAAIGHPILGDPAYGIMGEAGPNGGFDHETMKEMMPNKASVQLQLELDKYVKEKDQCLCLHARKLVLKHPITDLEMSFDFPAEF